MTDPTELHSGDLPTARYVSSSESNRLPCLALVVVGGIERASLKQRGCFSRHTA